MMLVVVPDVVREAIQWTVIRIRLRRPLHHVVLRQEMASCRMNGPCKECAQEEIQHHLGSQPSHHRAIECQLHCPIEAEPPVLWDQLWLAQAWPQGIGEDLAE